MAVAPEMPAPRNSGAGKLAARNEFRRPGGSPWDNIAACWIHQTQGGRFARQVWTQGSSAAERDFLPVVCRYERPADSDCKNMVSRVHVPVAGSAPASRSFSCQGELSGEQALLRRDCLKGLKGVGSLPQQPAYVE